MNSNQNNINPKFFRMVCKITNSLEAGDTASIRNATIQRKIVKSKVIRMNTRQGCETRSWSFCFILSQPGICLISEKVIPKSPSTITNAVIIISSLGKEYPNKNPDPCSDLELRKTTVDKTPKIACIPVTREILLEIKFEPTESDISEIITPLILKS